MKNIKQEIKNKTITFNAQWACDDADTDIHSALVDIMAKEIQKEIDNEIIISMLANWPFTYDSSLPEGWAGEHSIANTIGFDQHMDLYQEIVRWINSSVKNSKNNACWNKIGDCIYVKFRKKQDYVLYLLKYGHYSNG